MNPSETACSTTAAASRFARTARKAYDFIANPKKLFWLKVAIAVVAIFVLIKTARANVLAATLLNINTAYLAAAILLVAPNLGIQWLKWHFLLTRTNSTISATDSFKSLIVGFPLGIVTPGRFGEIARGLMIERIPATTAVTLAAIDKTTNMIVNLAVGMIALMIWKLGRWEFVAFSALLFLALTASLPKVPAIRTALRKTALRPWHYLFMFLCAIIFYSIIVLQLVILLFGFESFDAMMGAGAAAATLLVKTLLPISFGDLGVREGAAMFFFSEVGVSSAAAFSAAILLFAINVATPTLLGLCFLFDKSNHLKRSFEFAANRNLADAG
jgi:uncharacterized membrane protein YbhN (UPF0104 family)